MSEVLACSEIVCFSTYLLEFNSKGTQESKGSPQLLLAYGQPGSPHGSIKYLYSGSKSMKSENESSFIILHTCKHIHTHSLQKAFERGWMFGVPHT